MDNVIDKQYKRINLVLTLLMLAGMIIILFIQVQHFLGDSISRHDKLVALIDTSGIIGIIASAAFMVGGLVGFLFGVPQVYEQYKTQKLTKSTMFLQSDNMMQISDWLTKTIVGLSLTQLHKAPFYLESVGNYITTNLSLLNTDIVTIESVIIFYAIGGIGLSYLWSRRYFMRLLQLAIMKSEEEGQQGIELEQKQDDKNKKQDGDTNQETK